MDPDACLTRLIDAIEDNETEEASHAAEDLSNWLKAGGFMPKMKCNQFEFLLAVLSDLLRK